MNSELSKLNILLKKHITENLELSKELHQNEIEKQDLMRAFFLSIIKIIDSFESKEENLSNRYADNQAAQKTIKSYSSIKRQLLNLLKKYGVTVLQFPENRLIVGFSKVVDTEPNNAQKDDEIISIVKNGYIRGSELIREAELIVVKN